jgi:hypothetical protein
MAQNRWISGLLRRARRLCVLTEEVLPGCGRVLVVPIAALMLALAAQGQTTATTIDDMATPQDIETALHQMADKAGVIFVGRVVKVQRRDGGNVASGLVEITFQVDQAIRGCAAGSYVLREWAGLWEGDNQRYRAGQRLLMLLHAPNAAGLSSPVDGMDGAIPIVRGGSAAMVANSSGQVAPAAVDLRWVGTKLLHPVNYGNGAAQPAHPAGQAKRAAAQTKTLQDVAVGPVGSTTTGRALSGSDSPGSASVPAQQASVDVVVGMLTSWQKVQNAR